MSKFAREAPDHTDVECLVPECALMALSKGIDVVPCPFTRKRDFVRGNSNDVAVLFVDLALPLDELARYETVNKWKSRGGPELWTGKCGERVIVDVVDCVPDWILSTASI